MGYAHLSASSTVTPGADNFSESASGGMAGIAYSVADRNARESGMEAMRRTGTLPAPPSRAQYQSVSQQPSSYSPNLRPQGYNYPRGMKPDTTAFSCREYGS
jgi:hypothetical protein